MAGLDGIFAGANGVANRLLNLFGVAGVVTIKADDNYDPSTGDSNPEAQESYPVNVSPPLQYNVRDYDDSSILRGDVYCIINSDTLKGTLSTVSLEQLNHSSIEINNICFDIINVNPIYSGALVAAYKLQLRNDRSSE